MLRIWFRLAWDTRVQLSLVLPFDPQSLVVAGVGFFFFFLVNFSPSKSPDPSPQAGPREEGKRSTKSAPSTDPQLPRPAAGLQACRRSTQVNFGVSYLHLEKGLTWARLCQWQRTWGSPAANHRAARPSGSYPLVKEFSSLRESYLWPPKSATFCSVAAHCHDSGGTPRRPAASELGPHVRGPPLIPPFRLGEGASGRASESGEGGRKSRITCSSCSAISGALTHLHLHRLESPVSPEAEAPGKGERVHWIKHVTRVGQVSGSHAPAAATTTLGWWQLVCYFFFF